MNKKIKTRRNIPNKNPQRYYRIIQNLTPQTIPPLPQQPNQDNIDQISKIFSDKKFIYIDINDQKGYKFIEECSSSDSDEQTEQLGNNFISQLQNLSQENNKAVSYLFQNKKQERKKYQTLETMVDKVNRTRDRIKKNAPRNYSSLAQNTEHNERIHVYKGMDQKLLQKIKEQQQYDQLAQLLKSKQKNLQKNYNTVTTHRSRVKAQYNTINSIATKKTLKNQHERLHSFLPQLSSITSLAMNLSAKLD